MRDRSSHRCLRFIRGCFLCDRSDNYQGVAMKPGWTRKYFGRLIFFQRIRWCLVQVKDYYPRISVSNCKKTWKTSKLSLLLPDVRIEFNSKLLSEITDKAKICPLFRNETTSQYEYRIWICISLKHSFVTQCIFQTYKFEVRNSRIYR